VVWTLKLRGEALKVFRDVASRSLTEMDSTYVSFILTTSIIIAPMTDAASSCGTSVSFHQTAVRQLSWGGAGGDRYTSRSVCKRRDCFIVHGEAYSCWESTFATDSNSSESSVYSSSSDSDSDSDLTGTSELAQPLVIVT
jgi:hypothetical protein